jgi:hypothetical protein
MPADPATKEALRYRTALKAGFDSLKQRPLTTRTAEEVCTIIRDVRMTVRKVPGTKLTNIATGGIIYTPPEGESRRRDKLANWERFIHDDGDIDPVIRMAVSHYQFEAIHPWILYMLHATEDTAKWTLAKIEAVRRLIEQTAEFARKSAPKQYSREDKRIGLNKLFLNGRFLKLLAQESNDYKRFASK